MWAGMVLPPPRRLAHCEGVDKALAEGLQGEASLRGDGRFQTCSSRTVCGSPGSAELLARAWCHRVHFCVFAFC